MAGEDAKACGGGSFTLCERSSAACEKRRGGVLAALSSLSCSTGHCGCITGLSCGEAAGEELRCELVAGEVSQDSEEEEERGLSRAGEMLAMAEAETGMSEDEDDGASTASTACAGLSLNASCSSLLISDMRGVGRGAAGGCKGGTSYRFSDWAAGYETSHRVRRE
jgi:hypothetical protein